MTKTRWVDKPIEEQEARIIIKVSVISIIANIALASLKLVAGIVATSSALISDAVHSVSDVVSTFIVLIGAGIARKAPDSNHPYGHEKFEAIASLLLSFFLMATALGIGYTSVQNTIGFFRGTISLAQPGMFALIAAIISIVVKEAMYWYTVINGKKVKSTAMVADAWHHRSDAMSSLGSVVGVGMALLGFLFFDPLAAIVIAIIVLKVGISIFLTAVNQIVDKAPEDDIVNDIKVTIREIKGVKAVDELRARVHVSRLFVDAEIAVDPELSMKEAHEIAERVHRKIEEQYDDVKHITVHVNPYKTKT